MSGVTAPSILSDTGVGPLLDPVSISSCSLLGVSAGDGRAELGVPGVEFIWLGGMFNLRPAVAAGCPGVLGPPGPPVPGLNELGVENLFCKPPTICCGGSKLLGGAGGCCC